MLNFFSPLVRIFSRRNSPSGPAHLRTGEWGEQCAERHLRQKKYRILGRRVFLGKRDELDLIARSPDNVLVFVEVKTRADETFGRPFSAIDRRKRKALSRAAWNYMKRINPRPDYFRFDAIEVVGSPGTPAPVIRHIENAFPLEGKWRIPW